MALNKLLAMTVLFMGFISFQPALAQEQIEKTDAVTVLYASTLWKKDSNTVTGMWRIEDRGQAGQVLVLSKDFKTKSAPDLKLVLSPLEAKSVTKKNVLSQGRVVSLLKSNSGGQEFKLPDNIDLARYKSLAIHCDQYSKLWAASNLSKGRVVSASAWKNKTKTTKGGYEIVERDGDLLIRFSEDFKTAKAPEPLRILLSPHTVKEAKNKNAEEGSTFVTTLTAIKGGQEYKLDGITDLGGYKTVLLNCQKYTKLWAAASIESVKQ